MRRKKEVSAVEPDDDLPEITAEMLDRADLYHGDKLIRRSPPSTAWLSGSRRSPRPGGPGGDGSWVEIASSPGVISLLLLPRLSVILDCTRKML